MKKSLPLFIIIVLLILFAAYYYEDKEMMEETGDKDFSEDLEFKDLRNKLVEKQLKTRDITDKKVLEVMAKVSRHKFAPEGPFKALAYEDRPLPIGYGQTISQPYIVALMTQSLKLDKDDKVLEIGSGSGYQAAVLAEIVKEVYTIEIIDELAKRAEKTLEEQDYNNVFVKNADGYYGWPEKAKFDAVIVTAAANHIPPPLIEQMKDGGKLIIPLGDTLQFQTLTLVSKNGEDLEAHYITGVRFVPLTGKAQESKS